MKGIKTMKKIIALIGLLLLVGLPVKAQQYGLITTLANFQGDGSLNNTAATNIAAAVAVTKWDSVSIQVIAETTNEFAAGNIAVVWDVSNDNSNWETTLGDYKGWFNIPLSNSAANAVVWHTNLVSNGTLPTIGSLGYWRINWLTNQSGQGLTNLTIKVYGKPKRQG